MSSRDVFMALASKPWMMDEFNIWQNEVFTGILAISDSGEEAALRLLEMPFLETVDRSDDLLLEIIMGLLQTDPDSLPEFLDRPELAGGITDNDRFSVYMIRLEIQMPEAAHALGDLPWAEDGIDVLERKNAEALIVSALNSPGIFHVLLDKSWVQDGLTVDEASAIQGLSTLSSKTVARTDEALARQLLDMPFLQSVDAVDAKAVDSLLSLFRVNNGALLYQVLNHPALTDGISDEDAVVISAMSLVVSERPELLEVLLDPGQTAVEERVISLPLSGETTLAVISVGQPMPGTFALFESVVRSVEGFMAVPFPRTYTALLVADADSTG